jgi:hypothetical protein
VGLTFKSLEHGECFVVGKRQNHVCMFNPGFCGNFVCLRTKICVCLAKFECVRISMRLVVAREGLQGFGLW